MGRSPRCVSALDHQVLYITSDTPECEQTGHLGHTRHLDLAPRDTQLPCISHQKKNIGKMFGNVYINSLQRPAPLTCSSYILICYRGLAKSRLAVHKEDLLLKLTLQPVCLVNIVTEICVINVEFFFCCRSSVTHLQVTAGV